MKTLNLCNSDYAKSYRCSCSSHSFSATMTRIILFVFNTLIKKYIFIAEKLKLVFLCYIILRPRTRNHVYRFSQYIRCIAEKRLCIGDEY